MTEKIYIGMIARDTIKTECILALMLDGRIEFLHICRRSPPDNARNKVIRDFLKTDEKYLIWVDSDVVIPHDLFWLIDEEEFNEPVIAPLSLGLLNGQKIPMVFKKAAAGGLQIIPLKEIGTEPFEAYSVGCCWIVRRDVLEAVVDEDGMWHKQTWRDDDGEIRFGEDTYFFELIRKHGYKLIVVPTVRTGHVKYLTVR